MNIYAYALVALGAYLLLVVATRRARVWKQLGVTFYGPIMMVRTFRGRDAIARIAAKNRFWTAYGTISIFVTMGSMVVLTALIVWAVLATRSGHTLTTVGTAAGPGPSTLALFVYLAIGTSIAVLVHETVHGILSVTGKIKLDSLGLLLLLIPMGAFVEPNEGELKAASRRRRLRLYASGPATNILLAVICMVALVGFLSPSAQPAQSGAVVTEVAHDSPAELSGLSPWNEITHVRGERVANAGDFLNISFNYPGELTSIRTVYQGHEVELALPGGIAITSLTDGPALNAGLMPGMIVASLDGKTIHSGQELRAAVESAPRDRPVAITVLKFGNDNVGGVNWFVPDENLKTVNLTSKWVFYYLHYPGLNKEEYKNESYLGASASPFGVLVDDPEQLIEPVAHPLAGAKSVNELAGASVRFVTLPFYGRSPIVSPAADLYEPSGALSFLPRSVYWVTVNLVYWTFWANLMLGLSNALPAVPLDGALVLRDLLRSLVQRIGARLTGFDLTIGLRPISERQADRTMIVVTIMVSAMVLYLVLWQFFGPF